MSIGTSCKLYPLTHAQKRIWYTEQLHPGTTLHNIGGFIQINGRFDDSILKQAIQLFVQNHDGVRLQLTVDGGEIRQYVQPYRHFRIDTVDFSAEREPELALERWIERQAANVFPLYDRPLYEFATANIDGKRCGYFIKLHHVIADGWSIQLMTGEISDICERLLAGEPVQQQSGVSYLDYIEEEAGYASSKRFEKNKVYWNDKFAIMPDLPLLGSADGLAGRRQTWQMDEAASQRIQEFLDRYGCSLNTFFVALFLIDVHKTTQQEDIVIGNPVMNRSGKHKKIFGMFTSTMPFRMRCDGGMSTLDFMTAVNKELMKDFQHQKYPFDLLVQDLKGNRQQIGGLFHACVNVYGTRLSRTIGGFSLQNKEFYNGNQLYGLQLMIKQWSEDGRIELNADYKIGDYDQKQIEGMIARIMALAERVTANPEVAIGDLRLTTEEAERRLIAGYNDTAAEYPQHKTVVQLFEEQAERSPDAAAIVWDEDGSTLTYRQLNEKANQLARQLSSRGVGSQSIVAVVAHHSPELVIGIMAVLKAGGAYLPIDPDYPPERIRFMIQDSEAELFLTNLDSAADWAERDRVVDLNDPLLYAGESGNPDTIAAPGDLAYVIYTSGSTGNPKGAMIEHRGLVNYIWWAIRTYVKDERDSFALYSSIAFDLTVTSLFAPLVGGCRMIVYRDDGSDFILERILKGGKATIVKATPSHLSLLKGHGYAQCAVRAFIIGGEDFKVQLARTIYDQFDRRIDIYNEYGPTETVVGCMIHRFDPQKDTGSSVPIGHPIANMQVYVLDARLHPVPAGVEGELYISGDGVCRGYWKQAALTDSKFVPNPFVPGRTMYRSGDLARRRNDGTVDYLGRMDYQVKIRGHRIEVTEIEAQLAASGMVKDNAVISRNDDADGNYLCAYVTAGAEYDEAKLRRELAARLPSYMIPSYFVVLECLPLTPNGKLDRNALPAPRQIPLAEHGSEACLSELELQLASVYGSILGLEKIGRHDNFYHIGGDSIKAIQISSKLGELGLKVKVKHILSHPTIGQLAALDEIIKSNKTQTEKERTVCEGTIRPAPIVSWFAAQRLADPNHWNQSVFLELGTDIGRERLQQIIHELVKHHDSLRINMRMQSGDLYYNPRYLTEFGPVEEFDLSPYEAADQDEQMQRLGGELKSSMNMEQGCLLKACLFRLGKERRSRLLLTAHHLVVDTFSWLILLDDFNALIEAGENGQPFVLPAKTDSMQAWGEALERFYLREGSKEREYWEAASADGTALSFDSESCEETGDSCAEVTALLSQEETGFWLFESRRAYGTEPKDILTIALAQTVYHYTGIPRVVLELEGHGREEIDDSIDVSRTVGWFTSLFPVALTVEEPGLGEQIKAMKEQLRHIPSNGLGFGLYRYGPGAGTVPTESGKHIRLNYIGEPESATGRLFRIVHDESGADIGRLNHLTCAMELLAMIVDGQLRIKLTYSRTRYRKETAERFLERYINQIGIVLEHCRRKDARQFTPSDFDAAELSQSELDYLFKQA